MTKRINVRQMTPARRAAAPADHRGPSAAARSRGDTRDHLRKQVHRRGRSRVPAGAVTRPLSTVLQ